jgi:predicted nucleotidyltransferase
MKDTNTYLTELANQLKFDAVKTQRIMGSISFLKEKIWGLFQEKLSEVYVFGSYDRGTFIPQDPESDIDIIVVFKEKEFQPDTYLSQIRRLCENVYPRSNIYQDYPTIVIDLEHVKFEIVPSHIYGDSVKIPAPRTKELKWIVSNPKQFKNQILTKDKNNRNLIVPTIKIIKYWNTKRGKLFSSYDLERAIVNRTYTCSTLKDYFLSALNSLEGLAGTDSQKKANNDLKEHLRKLRVMENYKLAEYIEVELTKLIPFP